MKTSMVRLKVRVCTSLLLRPFLHKYFYFYGLFYILMSMRGWRLGCPSCVRDQGQKLNHELPLSANLRALNSKFQEGIRNFINVCRQWNNNNGSCVLLPSLRGLANRLEKIGRESGGCTRERERAEGPPRGVLGEAKEKEHHR
jgi:hypothetical protein